MTASSRSESLFVRYRFRHLCATWLVLVTIAIAALAAPASAQTTWLSSTVGGTWGTAGNWSNGVPTTTGTAVLGDATANRTVLVAASGTVATLTLNQTTANVLNELVLNTPSAFWFTNPVTLGSTSGTAQITAMSGTTGNQDVRFNGGLTLNAGGVLALGIYAPSTTAYVNVVRGNVVVQGGSIIVGGSSGGGSGRGTTTLSNNFTMTSGSLVVLPASQAVNFQGTTTSISGGEISAPGVGARAWNFQSETTVFNPTTYTPAASSSFVLNRSGSQSVTLGQGWSHTLNLRATGVKTVSVNSAATPFTELRMMDENISGTTSLRLGSDLTFSSGFLSADSTSGGTTLNLAIDTNGYSATFSSSPFTVNANGGAGVTNTVLDLVGSGSLSALGFTFSTGSTTVNVGPGLTLVASGSNRVNTLSGSGTIDPTSTFRYAALGTGTLVSTRAIGNVEVTSGTLRVTGLAGAQAARAAGGTLDLNNSGYAFTSALLAGGAITSGTLTSAGLFDFRSGTAAAVLAGAGGLTKSTSGTVTLSGANTFSGATTISEGILSVSGTSALAGTSGVTIAGGAGLTYTGGAATFSKNITVTAGSGTGTITNAGGGLLTLSGNLSKDNSVLRLTGGRFDVTGQITGATVGASDLLIDGTSTVTLSAVNTYSGPTFVNQASNLIVGINNAIPSDSVVTLGDATTSGTLTLGTFSTAIGGLTFGAGGGTLRIQTTATSAAPLTASAGTMTLANGTLDLAGSGSTAGVYRVLSAGTIAGSFASITGANSAYQVITSATSVDYQQRAVLGAVTVTSPTVSIITGGSAAFTYSVANSALSGGASLGFSSGSLSANLAGVSSGTAASGGASGPISGLLFTGTSVGLGQAGTFAVNAPNAFGATTATGTVSVNVLNHSLASFQASDSATLSLDLGTYDTSAAAWTSGSGSVGYSLWNIASGGFTDAQTAELALYDIIFTSGQDIFNTGLSTFSNLAAGVSNAYTGSVVSPGGLTAGTYQGVYTLKFRDQQNLSGAANTRDLALTMNVIVVPEPGAIALASIGIAAAGWSLRRRRRLS